MSLKLYNLSILTSTLPVTSCYFDIDVVLVTWPEFIKFKKLIINHTLDSEAPGRLIYSVLFLNSSQEI